MRAPETDPQTLARTRQLLLATDSDDATVGMMPIRELRGYIGGIKMPFVSSMDRERLLRACHGEFSKGGLVDPFVMIDGPIYAQSSHILGRYVRYCLGEGISVTIAPEIDPNILRVFLAANERVRQRLFVAGSSEEMGGSDQSKRALELCVAHGLAGIMCRARDLEEIDLGPANAGMEVVATGISVSGHLPRPSAVEAMEMGATRVVIGREIKGAPDTVAFIMRAAGLS
jgi:hypothetical protein